MAGPPLCPRRHLARTGQGRGAAPLTPSADGRLRYSVGLGPCAPAARGVARWPARRGAGQPPQGYRAAPRGARRAGAEGPARLGPRERPVTPLLSAGPSPGPRAAGPSRGGARERSARTGALCPHVLCKYRLTRLVAESFGCAVLFRSLKCRSI